MLQILLDANQKSTAMLKDYSPLLILLLLTISFNSFADDPQHTVQAVFDAMRSHDGDKLAAQFTPDAQLQRAEQNGEIKRNDLTRFATFVSQTDKYLDEKLLSFSLHQSDNLAAIWTPYAFYVDGKLSHCGVNSFQLVKLATGWKIQYLIDNTHMGDCDAFISEHS